MADSKFYQTSEKLTLDQIAKLCDLKLPKNIDKKRIFIDISPLDTADKDHVSFLNNNNYIDKFAEEIIPIEDLKIYAKKINPDFFCL